MSLYQRPALIAVDMQNDFCHPEGWVAKLGKDISYNICAVEKVKKLIEWTREKKIPIFYSRFTLRKDLSDAGLYPEVRPWYKEGGIREGTWGAEIVSELTPQPEDYIIDKHRFSAFIGTDLEIKLRGLRRDSVIMCGVATNLCVETTARDALQHDFRVILVKDCTGTYDHEMQVATEKNIEFGFGKVVTFNELSKLFENYRL